MRRFAWLFALLLALAPAAPVHQAAAQDVRVAAVVNGQAITTADIAARSRLLLSSFGQQPTPEALTRLRPEGDNAGGRRSCGRGVPARPAPRPLVLKVSQSD